jgi:hypothetical protein
MTQTQRTILVGKNAAVQNITGESGETFVRVDATTGALLTEVSRLPVSPVNISGTITTGGSAQVLAAANADRRGWWIRNNSTGSLWVSDMTTAVLSQPSLEIKAGELYEAPAGGVSLNALSIIGATTGQSFTGREW